MKFLPYLLCLFIAFNATAQNQQVIFEKAGDVSNIPVLKPGTSEKRRADFSEWYYFPEVLKNFSNTANFRTSLFPDSTVKQIYGTTGGGTELGYTGLHSMGQVLDPRSDKFEFALNRFSKFRLDSIAIPVMYNRFIDSNDMLLIQFYTGSAIRTSTFSDQRSFKTVAWDYKNVKGSNAIKEIEYPLGWADTSSNFTYRTIGVGLDIAAGDFVAVTVTYKPGYVFSVGDTLYEPDFPAVNKLNHVKILFTQDDGQFVDTDGKNTFYNYGLGVEKTVRYNISKNGWNGSYLPGNAWLSTYRHYNIQFKLTSNVSVGEIAGERVDIYPNPCNTGKILVSTNTLSGQKASVQVLDLSGKVLVESGSHSLSEKEEVNIESLNAGIYMLKIQTTSGYSVSKFIVEQ